MELKTEVETVRCGGSKSFEKLKRIQLGFEFKGRFASQNNLFQMMGLKSIERILDFLVPIASVGIIPSLKKARNIGNYRFWVEMELAELLHHLGGILRGEQVA